MNKDQLLQTIAELFTQQTALLRKEIKDSAEDVKRELRKKFRTEIQKSQEGTIETLTDVINESHGMLDKRVKRIEDHLDLPPIQQLPMVLLSCSTLCFGDNELFY